MPTVNRVILLLGSLALSLLLLVTLSPSPTAPPPVAAEAAITVDPAEPVEGDLISIRVDSYLPQPCYDVVSSHTVAGSTISIRIEATRFGEICVDMITPYSITEEIGVLSAGDYAVDVREIIDGGCWIDCTASASFTVWRAGDADGDGVSDDADNCPYWANPDQALPPWPVPEDDADCDGWSSADENALGTDPLRACGPSAWPPDVAPAPDGNGAVQVDDVTFAASAFGSDSTPRLEIASQDGIVQIDDLVAFAARFGLSC